MLGLSQKLPVNDTGDLDDGNLSCYSEQNHSSSSKYNKAKMTQQYYDYIVCIDFEATCWENQAPPKWRESEIIGKIYNKNSICLVTLKLKNTF